MDTLLRFDRGTLLLEGFSRLPEELTQYFRYDARINAYRAPAYRYYDILPLVRSMLTENNAPRYNHLKLKPMIEVELFKHQEEAIKIWQRAKGRGVIVLPTGAGKSLVGVLALAWAGRSSLIVVPTLDLMYQWYALLKAAFPDLDIGLLGGGYHEIRSLTVATYDSAAIHIDRYGNRFGLLLFDEVHHLPSEFYRTIAEFSLAPYRLGLTATPERTDQRHELLDDLIGPILYHKEAAELAGDVLAPFRISRIYVELSEAERESYDKALATRNQFLTDHNIYLSDLTGWSRFVMLSARSPEGRQAMRAHREARQLAQAAPAKLRTLELLLAEHHHEKTIIFTEDNATVYQVSQQFLIPAITHQTKVKERQEIITAFKEGRYRKLVTSKVLNEGVDVPDAAIGIILSGSSVKREFVQRLGRILRRVEGKSAILYEVIARHTKEERTSERRRKNFLVESPQLPLFADIEAAVETEED